MAIGNKRSRKRFENENGHANAETNADANANANPDANATATETETDTAPAPAVTATSDAPEPTSNSIGGAGQKLDLWKLAQDRNPLAKEMADYPKRRDVNWRKDKDGQPDEKPVSRSETLMSGLAQERGEEQASPCKHCVRRCGPFETCVVMYKYDGETYLRGECANCHWGGRGHRCSFVSAARQQERAQATKKERGSKKTGVAQTNAASTSQGEGQAIGRPQTRRKNVANADNAASSSSNAQTLERPAKRPRRQAGSSSTANLDMGGIVANNNHEEQHPFTEYEDHSGSAEVTMKDMGLLSPMEDESLPGLVDAPVIHTAEDLLRLGGVTVRNPELLPHAEYEGHLADELLREFNAGKNANFNTQESNNNLEDDDNELFVPAGPSVSTRLMAASETAAVSVQGTIPESVAEPSNESNKRCIEDEANPNNRAAIPSFAIDPNLDTNKSHVLPSIEKEQQYPLPPPFISAGAPETNPERESVSVSSSGPGPGSGPVSISKHEAAGAWEEAIDPRLRSVFPMTNTPTTTDKNAASQFTSSSPASIGQHPMHNQAPYRPQQEQMPATRPSTPWPVPAPGPSSAAAPSYQSSPPSLADGEIVPFPVNLDTDNLTMLYKALNDITRHGQIIKKRVKQLEQRRMSADPWGDIVREMEMLGNGSFEKEESKDKGKGKAPAGE